MQTIIPNKRPPIEENETPENEHKSRREMLKNMKYQRIMHPSGLAPGRPDTDLPNPTPSYSGDDIADHQPTQDATDNVSVEDNDATERIQRDEPDHNYKRFVEHGKRIDLEKEQITNKQVGTFLYLAIFLVLIKTQKNGIFLNI